MTNAPFERDPTEGQLHQLRLSGTIFLHLFVVITALDITPIAHF
jgi:hypothetical protein